MRVRLLYRARDFDREQPLPAHEEALRQDLGLDVLLDAMAAGDAFLREGAAAVVLSSMRDPEAIDYRQRVLSDCLERPAVTRELYDLAVEGLQAERQAFLGYRGGSPDTVLHGSVRVLELLVDALARLRRIADEQRSAFRSEGFRRFFAMVAEELDDDYFRTIKDHLRRLEFRGGVLISAQLGRGNKGVGHVLRRPNETRRGWRLPLVQDRSQYTFQLADRDEAGARALADLRARGINEVANALAQSTDHVLSFFAVLRFELGFYVACLNLHERLTAKGRPVYFPVPAPAGAQRLSAGGLYDPCLALAADGDVVGNDLAADRTPLVVITGANQGGKSTFLRAVGIAVLMTQCGMFVPAHSFHASVTSGVFTHFKREEDATMESGKLDEELGRMSDIADRIGPGALLLCNESFASTNEREGSEIARQIVSALVDASVRVVFVTHLFEFAHGVGRDDVLFLRAERGPGGRRTFRLREGEPLPTSHGRDVYERIFGTAVAEV